MLRSRSRVAILVLIVALVALGAWIALQALAPTVVATCDSRDSALPAQLATLSQLDLHPRGTTEQTRTSGCGDSGIGPAWAARTYMAGPNDRETIENFYRHALPRAGWKLVASTPSNVCVVGSVSGAKAHVRVDFLDQTGSADYAVSAVATYDQALSC